MLQLKESTGKLKVERFGTRLLPADMIVDGSIMEVLLVATKKDKLNDYANAVREAGLTPKVVDVDAFAIENMYCANYNVSPAELTAIVNIGASVMNINILKGGVSAFTRDITIGGNRYSARSP